MLFGIQTLFAQESDNIIGKKITIESKVLNDSKTIQIYFPKSYDKQKKYPVLYVLDGSIYFPLAVSVSNMLGQFNNHTVPEFIIIGIENTENPRARYPYFVDEKLILHDFLEKELIPYIDQNYSTNKERLLFGWQYAGSFAFRSMIKNKNLFNAYLISDPYPLMKQFDTVFDKTYDELAKQSFNNSVYLAVGNGGETVLEGALHLKSELKQLNSANLRFEVKQLKDEEHRSTAFNVLYHGLKFYHHNFGTLRIRTYQSYLDLGGVSHIKNYYKERAKRYSVPNEITPFTLFSLVRSAIRADDFNGFERLMHDFKPLNMVTKIRLRRAVILGEYYLKHNQSKKALELYESLNKAKGESEILLNAYGDVYKHLNETTRANEYYKKAENL